MACTPIPTQTIFSTGTYSTSSVSTSIFNSATTFTSTVTFLSTRCDLVTTSAGASSTCVNPTVITSTSLSQVTTTTPITRLTTVPVFVPQTQPIQTLYSPCPDEPTPTPPETSSTSQSTIIRTEYSTYTDSNGVHTTSTTLSSTTNGSLNGGGQTKSGPDLGPIIGGVVGGLVGLLAIIALVWYLLWRREQVKYLFDDDEYDGATGAAGVGAGGLKGNRPTALLAAHGGHNNGYGGYGGGRRASRNLNLDDEIKGPDAHPYQYGLVGGTHSPNGTMPSQPSTMGYGHQRNSSRDALMTAHSPPISPRHLDVPLPGQQQGQGAYGGGVPGRRASQYTGSSGVTDTIMMANQPPVGMANPAHNVGRVSDDRETPAWMGHHPRPSSSLLEAPVSYPPGHGGFYQQYGPIDPAPQHQQQHQQQQQQMQGMQPPYQQQGGGVGGAMHKPPLEPTRVTSSRPVPAHQALYAAAGLGSPNHGPPPNQDPYASMTQPYPPLVQSNTTTTNNSSRTQMLASPPPGAGGARQYPSNAAVGVGGPGGSSQNRQGDIFSAVMASGDAAAAATTQTDRNTSSSPDVGFGRQRRSGEKSPELRAEGPRSPVIQHQDGGRVPTTVAGSGPNTVDGHVGPTDAPPPAYSDP